MRRFVVVAFREGEPDRHHELSNGSCVIGRTSDVDLVLPDATVSRKHAAIGIETDHVVIEDLGSTNGVFVNGEQVKRATVRQGDFVTVGDYTLVLRALDDRANEPPPEGRTLCVSAATARQRHAELLVQQGPIHTGALYKAALLLGERMKLEPFLQQVVALVMESLPGQRGAIVLRRPGQAPGEVAAGVLPDDHAADVPVSRTLMDYVLRTDTALLTDCAMSDPRFSESDTILQHRVGAAMCVPLTGSCDTVGVLYVDASDEDARFTERDLGFLTAMGHLVGLAIESQQLGERTARQQRLAVLGEAVAGISHDVRNVLSGLTGGTDLLEQARQDMNAASLTSACGIIRKSAEQIESYLADLLAFVRETRVKRSPVCLNDLIRDVVDVMDARAKRRGVELEFLGGGHEPVNLDGAQLRRVIQNLVSNAIDACRSKGGAVTVSVGRQGNTHTVQVTDTGEGIAAENIPKLREPFFSTKGSGGTGLGLAISYRVVEQHGGRIHVSSRLGTGTVFTVLLPECPADEVEAPATDARARQVELAFRKCPGCNAVWLSQEGFLNDPSLALVGYQVRFEELSAGLFQFTHTCSTTLAVPVREFRHLYGGKTFDEPKTGTDVCPGYCKQEGELRPCPAECLCAQIREVLQVVRGWPKSRVHPGECTSA